MIPSVAILGQIETIRVCLIECDRALRHTIDTILLVGVQLANSVPMYSGAQVRNLVLDMDNELVAPAGLDVRSRVAVVEYLPEDFEIAIRSDCFKVHFKPVFPLYSLRAGILV